jgi:DinB superfamily
MDLRLDKLRKALDSAVEGMSGEQLSWHPPGKWCASEVLEHLYLTYTGTIKGFEKVIASGKPQASRASVAHRLQTLVVVGLGHMPAGRQAPATTRPKGLAAEKVRKELGARIAEMDALISQCEGRFGRRVRVLDHPILGPLSATQWRKLHVVHGRHHRKQLLLLREGAAGRKD